MIINISLLLVAFIYIYLIFRIKDEKKFALNAIVSNVVKEKIDSGFSGYLICVDEFNLLRDGDSLRKIYKLLLNNKSTLIYKLPKDEKSEDFDYSVIRQLKLFAAPCIIVLSDGKAVGESLDITIIGANETIRRVNDYIAYVNRELKI